MNKLWIGSVLLALGTVAVSFAFHREALLEVREMQSSAAGTTAEMGLMEVEAGVDRRPALVENIRAMAEPLPTADTTGLLQESLTVGELLDAIDADTGEDFRPVDRERLAALLTSDPELQRAVRE